MSGDPDASHVLVRRVTPHPAPAPSPHLPPDQRASAGPPYLHTPNGNLRLAPPALSHTPLLPVSSHLVGLAAHRTLHAARSVAHQK